jgi:SAM-dependent methyltransferase
MIYVAIPDAILGAARALQFSPDIAAPRERFQSFEVSVYGGDNALDIMQIARPVGSYDWVIANHVIEHVPDDHRALSEMARVLTREGVMQITVPTPATELETREFGFADPARQGHYRAYGSDFPRVASGSTGLNALQATAFDPATGAFDHVYFFCRRREPLLRIGRALIESRIPAILWT